MKFLKIAGKDIGDIFKNRFIRVSVIAIIIVPLLYSLLYLDAFWDPYSKLQDMPVAVVNLDKGSTNDGSKVNYGEDLINNLKENTAIGWRFTNEKDADEGVNGEKYYAKLVIPEDFSQKVLAAKDGKPQIANVIFTGNEKKNFLAAQINSRLQVELKAEIVKSISNNYVEVTFDSLYKSKDGIEAAADGSKQLYDGLSTLNDKVPALEDGIKSLNNGSTQLLDGQVALNDGINKVSDGIGALNDKVPQLSKGVSDLYIGSNALKDGVAAAKTGSEALSLGSKELYLAFTGKIYPSVSMLTKGANDLNNGLQGGKSDIEALNSAVNPLKIGSTQVAAGSTEVENGYSQVKAGVDDLVKGVENTSTSITEIGIDLQKLIESNPELLENKDFAAAVTKLKQIQEDNKDLPTQLKELSDGSKALQDSISTFNDGVQGYTDNVNKFADGTATLITNVGNVTTGVNQISTGLNSLQAGLDVNNKGSFGQGMKGLVSGSSDLNKGIGAINSGAVQINGGLGQLNEQTPVLTNGVSSLYQGSTAMRAGSEQLVNGQEKLNTGVKELDSNVPALKDGVNKLYDGSQELSDKLASGAKELKDGLKNPSNDMAEFISSPIDFINKPINSVPNYGTGFAPYFIPLSLWIGAIMMFFVIPSKVDEDENATKFDKVVGKYISFAFVGVLQAVLVSIVVLMLGLKPTSIPMFFLINIFLSLVFISIIQCLIFLFGDAGRLLSIVLLILQLTACGGTFPLEVIPGFFKVLNPFMPFTYAVEALREVISATNINYGIIGNDMFILTVVFVVFITISTTFVNVGERLTNAIEGRKAA